MTIIGVFTKQSVLFADQKGKQPLVSKKASSKPKRIGWNTWPKTRKSS